MNMKMKRATNNTLQSRPYTFRVNWSPEDAEYVGLCAEFPSLSWLAAKREDALAGIRRVVDDASKDMQSQTNSH